MIIQAIGNLTGAAALRELSSSIAAAVDKHLWSGACHFIVTLFHFLKSLSFSLCTATDNDHYFTQLNSDGVTTRDFVDYDANAIALAFGIPSADRAHRIMQRIDGGRCTHGRATFVSEKYYGPDDTTHGNIGDSWCSMGRIGWFDALARKRYGDLTTFDNLILNPLRDDLNRWTWLHERYACDGSPQLNRTYMYFEYPSTVTMLTRHVRYGIELRFTEVNSSRGQFVVGHV